MKFTHLLACISLIMLILFNVTWINAQDLFEIKENKISKSDKVIKWKDHTEKSILTKSIWSISLNDLKKIQKNRKFTFTIPDDKVKYVATAQTVKYYDDENYYWSGLIQDDKNRYSGTLNLAKSKGSFYVEFNVSGRSFVIDDLGQDLEDKDKGFVQYLVEKDVKELDAERCGVISDHNHLNEKNGTTNSENDKQVETRSNICPVRVRVLVLYTQRAASAVGNIPAKTGLMMEELNAAMENTGVDATSTRFTLAATMIYNGTMINDLVMNNSSIVNMLASGQDIYVNSLRAQYNADLVSIITNVPSGLRNGNYGFANQPFYTPYPSNLAYSAVHYDHTGRYTFVHEIGHNFGCRHDNDGLADSNYPNSDPRWAARGKVVQDCNVSTIMVELDDFNTKPNRVLYFSNPALDMPNCDGGTGQTDRKLGTINSRNNYRMFVDFQQNTIANYYQSDAPHVAITGNNIIYDNFTYTWCPILSCGFGTNISYQWSWSLDGFTYFNPIASTECIALTPSYFGVSNVSITLRLVANNGYGSHTSFFQVFVAPNINARPFSDTFKNLTSNNKYLVYPNPSSTEALVNLNLQSESKISIDVYNNLGQWEHSVTRNQFFTSGNHTIHIDLANSAKGFKVVHINDGIKIQLLPVIIK